METDIRTSSFLVGLVIFALCLIGIISKAGQFVLVISNLLPGLVFGVLLMAYTGDSTRYRNKLIFVMLSTVIYILLFFFINIKSYDKIVTSLKLIAASSLGAVTLKTCYDFLTNRNMNLKETLLLPFVFGFISSLLSAFCMYKLHYVDLKHYVIEVLVWAGMFIIFPIWQLLFSINIKRHRGSG